MEIRAAQFDLRQAYISGACGALVSGLVWIIAGLTAHFFSFQASIVLFFLGGMAIVPLSTLLSKLFNDKHIPAKNNPLLPLGLQVTVILFVGLFLAFWLCLDNPEHFYALMLMIIGARYVPFVTLYGSNIYWALGLTLTALGFAAFFYIDIPGSALAIAGGLIEVIFAAIVWRVPRADYES
ncbi:hypothetical protein N9W89_06110 [Hellea sp.]|nr:hypothetical protein [Hellea sp.]